MYLMGSSHNHNSNRLSIKLTYGPNQNLALLDLALTLDTGHWTLDAPGISLSNMLCSLLTYQTTKSDSVSDEAGCRAWSQ